MSTGQVSNSPFWRKGIDSCSWWLLFSLSLSLSLSVCVCVCVCVCVQLQRKEKFPPFCGCTCVVWCPCMPPIIQQCPTCTDACLDAPRLSLWPLLLVPCTGLATDGVLGRQLVDAVADLLQRNQPGDAAQHALVGIMQLPEDDAEALESTLGSVRRSLYAAASAASNQQEACLYVVSS